MLLFALFDDESEFMLPAAEPAFMPRDELALVPAVLVPVCEPALALFEAVFVRLLAEDPGGVRDVSMPVTLFIPGGLFAAVVSLFAAPGVGLEALAVVGLEALVPLVPLVAVPLAELDPLIELVPLIAFALPAPLPIGLAAAPAAELVVGAESEAEYVALSLEE